MSSGITVLLKMSFSQNWLYLLHQLKSVKTVLFYGCFCQPFDKNQYIYIKFSSQNCCAIQFLVITFKVCIIAQIFTMKNEVISANCQFKKSIEE